MTWLSLDFQCVSSVQIGQFPTDMLWSAPTYVWMFLHSIYRIKTLVLLKWNYFWCSGFTLNVSSKKFELKCLGCIWKMQTSYIILASIKHDSLWGSKGMNVIGNNWFYSGICQHLKQPQPWLTAASSFLITSKLSLIISHPTSEDNHAYQG